MSKLNTVAMLSPVLVFCLSEAASGQMQERSEIAPAYQWRLEDLYPSDEAWEQAKEVLAARLGQIEQYRGKLNDAATLLGRAFTSGLQSERLDIDRTIELTVAGGMLPRLVFKPSAIAGILLVLGGVFSFLPVLGIWMLPLGLLLLALDLPFLQGPLNSLSLRIQRRWTNWRRRRKAKRD